MHFKIASCVSKETCLDAFETKRLRKILCVSWTAKETNEWVVNSWSKEGTVSMLSRKYVRKLAYYGHTIMKQRSCLEKENARNNARCTQARKVTHGLDEQHPRRGQDSAWKSQ